MKLKNDLESYGSQGNNIQDEAKGKYENEI